MLETTLVGWLELGSAHVSGLANVSSWFRPYKRYAIRRVKRSLLHIRQRSGHVFQVRTVSFCPLWVNVVVCGCNLVEIMLSHLRLTPAPTAQALRYVRASDTVPPYLLARC